MGDKEEREGPDSKDLLHVLVHGQTEITNLILQGQQSIQGMRNSLGTRSRTTTIRPASGTAHRKF